MSSLATFNSFLRTLIALFIVVIVSVGSWFGYDFFQQLTSESRKLKEAEQLLAERDQQIDLLQTEVERLDTANHLLKVDHRLAKVTVVDQFHNDNAELHSTVEFQEIDENDTPIGQPRQFTFKGDKLHVSGWIVKFEDHYIENADLNRGTSIFLFKKLYGDFQTPNEGFSLDPVGVRPSVYARNGEPSPFEQKIWSDFWNISIDPAKAHELGIRAAHGEAVSTKLRKGMTYRFQLRASGGLTPVIPKVSEGTNG
ncbi:MAG: hypothetical protein MPJ24_07675 [Pirellulaceae bacterium]|nr:hypothetical protein [Pirellulaceae bacterium]